MGEYLEIRNWERWQSYRKDRTQPPWIKLHREVMRNPEWVSLTDAQRGQLVSIWILAADRDGKIPATPSVVGKLCYMDSEPDLQLFISLGFIEPDVKVASTWRQGDVNVTPQRRGEERREETEKRGERAREGGGQKSTTPACDGGQPDSPPSLATARQMKTISEMADERDLTVEEVKAGCGLEEIGAGDVTRVLDFLRSIPKLSPEQKAEKARSEAAMAMLLALQSVYQRDGPEEAVAWVRRQEREDHDPRVIKRLWARLTTLNNEQEAMA